MNIWIEKRRAETHSLFRTANGIENMRSSCALRPGWNPLTIVLMVLGFIVFWPLGLAIAFYNIWGDQLLNGVRDARDQWQRSRWRRPVTDAARKMYQGRSGNEAFDAYRERELKRLEEERAKIDAMRAEFDEFMQELRRARDQEEFDRFMSRRNRGASA